MLNLFLQIWGALFFLLNKVFFSLSERNMSVKHNKTWLVSAWLTYLIGLPAWVLVFITHSNWIAAAVESSVVPSMIVGLLIAWRGKGKEPLWLSRLSRITILIGLILSLYQFSGITSINQVLELGLATGFIIGTHQMAKRNPQGYLWFILGNVSCAILMGMEGFILLMIQQLLSLFFVVDAYLANKRILVIST